MGSSGDVSGLKAQFDTGKNFYVRDQQEGIN